MISLSFLLPFLLPCSSAVLTEPPRSRSTSGLGVVGLYVLSSAVHYSAAQCVYSAGYHRRARDHLAPACQIRFIFYNPKANLYLPRSHRRSVCEFGVSGAYS